MAKVTSMHNCTLLRYGEIGLKSKGARIYLEKLYKRAIKEALKRNKASAFKIKNEGGRFIVFSEENIIPFLKKVPGIQSLSPAINFNFKDKKELLKKIKTLADKEVKNRTFAVRVKRVGKHDFTSQELEREAGAALYKASKGVNLHQPEITINLEIREQEAYLYSQTEMGLGGLPAASSGKVLMLFSGGIDSPVAAYQLLKRGCALDFLFINLIEEKSFNQVAKIYNFLISQYAYNYQPKFYLVDGRKIVQKIKEEVPGHLRQIALKIVFYQIGEKISEILATGEAISQKSSQTLDSLKMISSQSKALVLRPLLGMDKLEIIRIAEQIGTLASSEKVKELCNLTEGPARTAPTEHDLTNIPSFNKLIEEAVVGKTVFSGRIDLEEDLRPELEQPIIVDIDGKIEEAEIKFGYPEIMAHLDEFDREKEYLILCEEGVQSENVAFALRRKGIKAAGISYKQYDKLKKR